jgi:hypothetical protein
VLFGDIFLAEDGGVRSSSFAKASPCAKATEDETEDRAEAFERVCGLAHSMVVLSITTTSVTWAEGGRDVAATPKCGVNAKALRVEGARG